HVAQCSGFSVKRAAPFDTDILCCRDLNVINVVAVPDRLENSIGKAKNQDVLYRFFAEIVIDTKDLLFVENLVYLVIQLSRRLQIMTERLLDNHPRMALFRMRHTVLTEAMNNVRKIFGSDSEIEKPSTFCSPLLIDFFHKSFQLR